MDQNPIEWVETVCNACGASGGEFAFEGPDRLEKLPGRFRMVRCLECGAYRQNPRPTWEHLQRYYPEDYAAYQYADQGSRLKKEIRRYGLLKRLRAIQKFQPGGRLLEVGCGTGHFLKEAADSGNWQVVGIEPSPSAAAFVSGQLGLQVHQGRFSEIPLPPESFDAIVFWCVLEHLDCPVDDLRYAHSLLKKNGWLFASIPNFESLETRIFGQYWAGWDLPRHLYVFPRPSLYRIMSKIGFRVIDERCLTTSYDILGHSLEFWSQSWESKHPKAKRFLIRSYRSLLGRLAMILPLAVLDRLRLTSTLTIFAQKT